MHYEWTTKSFPDSVPWDYAYYVIPNDAAAHEGGYLHDQRPGLSKILEDVVEAMPIDFHWQLRNSPQDIHLNLPGEFTHGLGYSFDKDPDFRYCATSMSLKYGIETYENYWLGICRMTGGSSGGPMVKDLDDNGRGTVVSINSWGYTHKYVLSLSLSISGTSNQILCSQNLLLYFLSSSSYFLHSPGMGGPKLATAAGSHAECLYERARTAKFEDVVDRGVIVADC